MESPNPVSYCMNTASGNIDPPAQQTSARAEKGQGQRKTRRESWGLAVGGQAAYANVLRTRAGVQGQQGPPQGAASFFCGVA